MANVNKALAEAVRKNPRRVEATPGRNSTPFSQWLIAQAQAGASFRTLEEAQAAFESEGK